MSFLSLYQSLPTIAIIVFFVLIVGIVLYFSYAYKKEQELTDAEKKNLTDYERILMKAHRQARSVVETATKKAQRILDQTTDFDRDALSILTKQLQQETADMIHSYHNSLTATAQGQSQTMQHAAEDMEKLTEREIQAYTQSLQKTLVVSQGKIEQEVSADVEKAKAEIEAYKTDRLAKVDEQISQLANKLALEVLGHAISLDEHEKLIVESLNKAKNEGLFSV